MAILPPIKRFVTEDFSGLTTITAFANKLFYPLNLFLNATYSALNNGLTINANSIGMISQNVSITTNSSGVATTSMNWSYPQTPPVGVSVISCLTGSTPQFPPMITWSYSAGVVTINMQFVVITSGAVVVAGTNTYSCTFWINGG